VLLGERSDRLLQGSGSPSSAYERLPGTPSRWDPQPRRSACARGTRINALCKKKQIEHSMQWIARHAQLYTTRNDPFMQSSNKESPMSYRPPPPDLRNIATALKAERTAMVDFIRSLGDEEWSAPSAADGWRIADVVGHIGATARSFYTPSGLRSVGAPSLEALN
jgi:hypothetical protein